MRHDTPARQEGTAPQTITVELTLSEARQIHGLLDSEHKRCRNADESAERDWAPYFAGLKEKVMMALREADR